MWTTQKNNWNLALTNKKYKKKNNIAPIYNFLHYSINHKEKIIFGNKKGIKNVFNSLN